MRTARETRNRQSQLKRFVTTRGLRQHRAVMPSPISNSGIRDNHSRGLVGDFLRAKIKPGSRLSVVSAYFTIYAYEILASTTSCLTPLVESIARTFQKRVARSAIRAGFRHPRIRMTKRVKRQILTSSPGWSL